MMMVTMYGSKGAYTVIHGDNSARVVLMMTMKQMKTTTAVMMTTNHKDDNSDNDINKRCAQKFKKISKFFTCSRMLVTRSSL